MIFYLAFPAITTCIGYRVVVIMRVVRKQKLRQALSLSPSLLLDERYVGSARILNQFLDIFAQVVGE